MPADAPSVIVADTHVHVYPDYNLPLALRTAFTRLPQLAHGRSSPDALLLFLTERRDCHFFQGLKSAELRVPSPEFRIETTADSDALCITDQAGISLFLLAGRQIISREKIEVLALTRDLDLPDGIPVRELLPAVREGGALPVLSWAPGKWFFGRGRILRDVIDRAGPGDFLVGDTTLRPVLWPEPALMQKARAKGLRVIAGSDPLPFAGEESVIGQYGICVEGVFDPQQPARSARRLLRDPDTRITLAGRRANVVSMLTRLKKNHDSKRRTP